MILKFYGKITYLEKRSRLTSKVNKVYLFLEEKRLNCPQGHTMLWAFAVNLIPKISNQDQRSKETKQIVSLIYLTTFEKLDYKLGMEARLSFFLSFIIVCTHISFLYMYF